MEKEKLSFLTEIEKLKERHALAAQVTPDYYEPGMMEYLEQFYGDFDESRNAFVLRLEVKGTRYEGRTELIETVKEGEPILVERDKENSFNPNNFTFFTKKRKNLGHMPAELCNAVAPLYDEDDLEFHDAKISYVEPISKRSRHAKQAILFVELTGMLK